MRLFHVSDHAGIERFDPRPIAGTAAVDGLAVWAVDEVHLPHYLLPRDCPRVCFATNDVTSEQDRHIYLSQTMERRVVAVEWEWLLHIQKSTLFVYELPPDSFELIDWCAGYFISREPVVPVSVVIVEDVLAELSKRDVELRLKTELWGLHDSLAKSTLDFSMIRMRNAHPRMGIHSIQR